METGLPLMCATPNKRPRHITPTMARQAATMIADELVKNDPEFGDITEIVSDILDVTSYDCWMDGYQIASALERHKYWECDMSIAEIMDNYSSYCSSILRAAEKQWGQENPMEPPHPIRSIVQTPRGTGMIEEIYQHAPNSFVVLVKDKHLIIPFEDTIIVA